MSLAGTHKYPFLGKILVIGIQRQKTRNMSSSSSCLTMRKIFRSAFFFPMIFLSFFLSIYLIIFTTVIIIRVSVQEK